MNQVNSAYLTTPQISLVLWCCVFKAKWCLTSRTREEDEWMNEWMLYLSFEEEIFISWLDCDWPTVIHSAHRQLVCNACYLIWHSLSLCCADPEAALQQQHGWAPLPLPVSSWICGVPASKQQGDPPVWQKQCACTTGNCLIPLNHS